MTTSIKINLQIVHTHATHLPGKATIAKWLTMAVSCVHENKPLEVNIRITNRAESAALNTRYRHKTGPTNVLSFPSAIPKGINSPLLGDIVICAPLVKEEAQQQHKPVEAHWALLCIHGFLHLLGYEHGDDRAAKIMEKLEMKILGKLGLER
jgi:probable rRNA maturation factor